MASVPDTEHAACRELLPSRPAEAAGPLRRGAAGAGVAIHNIQTWADEVCKRARVVCAEHVSAQDAQ